MKRFKMLFQIALASLACVGATACCSTSVGGGRALEVEFTPQRIARLQFGMPEGKVREILGDPGMQIGPDDRWFRPIGSSPDWREAMGFALSDIHLYRRWHYGLPPLPEPAPGSSPTGADMSDWIFHPIRSFEDELGEALSLSFAQAFSEWIAPSPGTYIVVFHAGGLYQVLRSEGAGRLTPCMTPPESGRAAFLRSPESEPQGV